MVAVLAILLFWWMFRDPTRQFTESTPGGDHRGGDSTAVGPPVKIGEKFESFATLTSSLKGTWPRFRGPDYDNIVKNSVPLKNSWSGDDPEIKWSVELGEGHAGPAIYEGKVYVMDYDEAKREDALRCFALEDGKELWRRSYGVSLKRNHGMSRTVPAVTADYILTIGPRCHVMCVKRETGDLVWGIDMVQQYKTEVPLWFTGQCPMVDIARFFLSFTQNESCGKCTFCRVGTKRMLDILTKITTGKGTEKDLDELQYLAHWTKKGSLCGLGKSAPNPILSTLKYFREEYIAHINGKCPSGKCQSLIKYQINDLCIGCTKCAQKCPTEAILFKPHEKHVGPIPARSVGFDERTWPRRGNVYFGE